MKRIALLLGALALIGAAPRDHWVGSWASSQQVPEPHNALPADALADATLRQVVRLSIGGDRLRVRVSNAFGTEPLRIASVHVARAVRSGSPATIAGTDRAVSFDGKAGVVVPAGADYWSDPVALPVSALGTVAVSIHFAAAPATQTGHPGSRTTSWVVKGDRTAAADLAQAIAVDHWYQLAGIDVAAAGRSAALVTMGDSITDGRGSTTNGNDRWPDLLAARFAADPRTAHVAVLNHGIGGNRVLADGLGPSALARFDRDMLSQSGARWLLLLEGVNDLGTFATDGTPDAAAFAAHVDRLTGAYAQIVTRARARGIRVIGGTVLPFGGFATYRPAAGAEVARRRLNAWIRTPGNFDAVVDFDRVMRDPARPDRLLAAYDSGDGIHPNPTGFAAMAAAVPLDLFAAR